MKKIFVIGLLVALFCTSLAFVLFVYCRNGLLEVEPSISLQTIPIDKDNEICIEYSRGNATSRDYLQVFKKNNKERKVYILENYERYNYLVEYNLIGDSLTLILKDTITHHVECIDTFCININDYEYQLEQ